jgi:beta-glucosidase
MLILFAFLSAASDYPFPLYNPNLTVEERADWLANNLSLKEKVSQMMNGAAGILRLNIPPYDWWSEALHGVLGTDATVFPEPIGMGASFDPEGVLKAFRYVSEEGRAKYENAIRHGHHSRLRGLTFWAPNINIFRDPRWGRGQETYGEDPFLTSTMGTRVVTGMQGSKVLARYYRVVSCAKHYAVHSGPEPERHRMNVNPTKRDLAQTYLVGFKALVEAGVGEVMCAYNAVNGQPACGSDLLFGKLRSWNFTGVVTSDCGAIDDFYRGHHTHPDAEHASADAVRNGTSLECGNAYRSLVSAVHKGLIAESELTKAVKTLYRQRIYLGMFDPPELVNYSRIPYSVVRCEKHARHARLMAREAMVLLQNDGILPLNKSKKVLVVGPNADSHGMLLGNYNGYNAWETKTILEALVAAGNVEWTQGCDYDNANDATEDLWVEVTSGGRVGCEGKFYPNMDLQGTPTIVRHVERLYWNDPGGEESFGGRNFTANQYSASFEGSYTATESETLQISLSWDHGARADFGNLAHFNHWNAASDGKESINVNVTAGQTYSVRADYRHNVGGSNFDFAIHRHLTMAQSMERAKEKAKRSDAVIFVGGICGRHEGEEHCRGAIELPEIQRKFLDNLKEAGKPLIFVLCSGSPVAFDPSGLSAALAAWYAGEGGGRAVADVIYGDYNPAGRLPVTFYTSTSELNEYHDYDMLAGKGRTYRYYKGKPLFPFGHGLSYTKFQYSDLQVMGDFTKGLPVDVSFVLRNVGALAGDEVSQIYVTAVDVPGEPIKALKWFLRQPLEAAERIEIVARLHHEAFMVFDEAKDELVLRPGKFRIWVGGSSDDKDLLFTDVSFPKTLGDNKWFLGNKGSSGCKVGVIGGLIGIAIVAVAVGIIYGVKRRRMEVGCSSGPLLSE